MSKYQKCKNAEMSKCQNVKMQKCENAKIGDICLGLATVRFGNRTYAVWTLTQTKIVIIDITTIRNETWRESTIVICKRL